MQRAITTSINSLCRLEKGVLPCAPGTNVRPYFSEAELLAFSPEWTEADLSEHLNRARANPLRAAGLSKAWTALLQQWFTGGWFLVEGDSQPSLHDMGIKPGDTCAAAEFNLVFQQFQEFLRNSLKQVDLVTEIPLGQEKIFLSSPVSTTTALNGPTFLWMTMRCCSVGTAHHTSLTEYRKPRASMWTRPGRNFGLTLNRGAGVVVSKRKGTSAFPCSDSGRSGCSLAQDSRKDAACLKWECKHVGTWISSAASSRRDISYKASVCHHGLSAGGQDRPLEKAIPTGAAYQSHATPGGILPTLQFWWMGRGHSVSVGQT